MALIDTYNFEILENEAEKLVFNELEQQLAAYDDAICRCNECVVDMAAMALNGVKPLYRVSLLGTLYAAEAMADEVYANSIREAVSKAIKKVGENPSH
jgi:competence protein ComFB